jgi:uncharacterized protein
MKIAGKLLGLGLTGMLSALALFDFGGASAHADQTYFNLATGNFLQDWSDTGLITTDDVWSGVGSIEGYRGDNLTTTTNVDPQTVVAPGTEVLDVNADETDPNVFNSGGLAEFAITDPTVALNGSGTADAPFLLFYLNTTGRTDVTVNYDLRDLDGSIDNSTQQVALQYRVGTTGDFINLPGGYVADASSGPELATLVTPVSVVLPTEANNQAQIQVRVITTNAGGNDEWIGVDNIAISSVPGPSSLAVFALGGLAPAMALLRRRRAAK